jgi:hypothetical protein
MNFNQDGVSRDQILKSLRALIVEGAFKADSIIVDGLDFSRIGQEHITAVKAFVRELGVSAWYTCNIPDKGQQYNEQKIPLLISGFADLIDVVILLEPKQDHIELSVSKDRSTHDTRAMAMRLDPKTLLILEG